MLEKTLESPLDYKEIQPVHSKGDQSWVFFGRTDANAETPVLWPPHGKSNMETYIIICKIDSQWEFAVYLRKLKLWLCINLEEWDEEGEGEINGESSMDACTLTYVNT